MSLNLATGSTSFVELRLEILIPSCASSIRITIELEKAPCALRIIVTTSLVLKAIVIIMDH